MSFINGWKNNKNSTPGASPTSTSPLSTSTISNANSVSGLGPLGSTSNTSTSSLSSMVQPIVVVSNSPPLSSSSSSTPNNNNTSTSINNNISMNNSGDTIGKSSSITIDTSQFNNNYVGASIFGGQPINPNTELGSSILNKFSKFLLSKGFNTEGIFRPHPELENEIQNVKKNLLKDLSISDSEQVHLPTLTQNPLVIAELMKQYLSLLPEPLFSFQLYDSFLLTHSILSPTDRVWAYRFLLLYLPVGFRGAIKSVLSLLTKVHQCSESSKMNSESLAKIFSPVFLRPEEEMYYMNSDQSTLEEIVKLWIEEFDIISKPPTNPNPRVSTILGSANANLHHHSSPLIQQHLQSQQQQQPQFLNQSNQHSSLPNIQSGITNISQSSMTPPSHPTIGMNKVNTNITSPKLSLPTITKDDKQQIMTIIKKKPILEVVEPSIKSPSTPPPTAHNNNNNSNNTSQIASTKPIPIIPPSPEATLIPTPSPSSSPSSSINKVLPMSPISSTASDQEVEEKVKKIKISIDSIVSEQALLQIKNLLKSIEKEYNYNHIIRFSSILRDAKKHMNESTEKLLSMNRGGIREFIQEYPKPLSYNLLASSMPILDSSTFTDNEKKANDLKRASQVAADEISDYIYFFKLKISTFKSKEEVISTAQIFSKLKSILDNPPPKLITANSWSDLDSSLVNNNNNNNNNIRTSSSSPTSSPSAIRNNKNNNVSVPSSPLSQPQPLLDQQQQQQISENRATIRIMEVCSQEIKDRFSVMKNALEVADINSAFEIGKNIRYVKSTLTDVFTQCNLVPPPEVKPSTTPGDDQLTTLRKALPPLLDRFSIQIDQLNQRVITIGSNLNSSDEITIIVDTLLFINKTLSGNFN